MTDDYLYVPANLGDTEWCDLMSVKAPSDSDSEGAPRGPAYLVLSVQTSRGWVPREWSPGGNAPEVGVALLVRDFRGGADSEAEGGEGN